MIRGGSMVKKVVFSALWSIVLATCCFAGITINEGLSREHTVRPGEKVDGKITLSNTTDTAQQVKIYQTDYWYAANGEVKYGEPGKLARSNAGWISMSPVRLTIPPRESASVSYTIQVPEKLDLTGTYWSMVMVEPFLETNPETNRRNHFGIQTIIRYGIQIVTDIGVTGKRQVHFADKKLIYENDRKFLQIDIENTGESWLRPSTWVELYDGEGKKVGRFESEKKRIYPGCSIRQYSDLTRVPKGKYKALVAVESGDDYIAAVQYDVRIE